MNDDFPPIPWTPSDGRLDEIWAGDGQTDPIADQVPDMLKTIFAQQEALMRSIWEKEIASGLSVLTSPFEWGQIDNRRIQARIHESYGHVVRELSEAMAHLDGSKSWKLAPRAVNREAFREEMADVLHFFFEMCIIAGIDAEALFLEYFGKSRVNFQRIEDQY